MLRKRCTKGALVFITAICFVIFALINQPVFAADGVADSASDFTISSSEDGEQVYITGLAKEVAASITSISIPSEIEGKPVTYISADAFNGMDEITKVVIPDSVREIGNNAFYNCSGIKEFTIPIDIKASNCFVGCVSTEKITYTAGQDGRMIDKDNRDWVPYCYQNSLEYRSNALQTVVFENGVKYIGNYAFLSRKNLVNVTMPDNEVSLGLEAFYDCSSIQKIDLSKVTSYGEYSFYNCKKIKSIDISKDATSIARHAFVNCIGIEELVVPENIQSLGFEAFKDCTGLTKVTIAADLNNYNVFVGCNSIKHLVYTKGESGRIPDSDTRDWYSNYFGVGLSGVSAVLETVKLSDGIEYVGTNTFRERAELNKVEMPDNDITLGDYAFYICPKLSSISTSKIIGYNSSCFSGCKSLKTISINEKVTSISTHVFDGCEGLTEIVIPETVRTLGEAAFANCTGVTKITIPVDVSSYRIFTGCTAIKSLVYTKGENGTISGSDERDWYSNYYLSNVAHASGVLESIYLSDGIVDVGSCSFENIDSLVEVRMPENEISLGYKAFQGCDNLPAIDTSKVTSIGQYVYEGCKSLESIEINENITAIPSYAFSGCESLKEVVIPDAVTSIGEYAFAYCSGLTKLSIPIDVATNFYRFDGCSSIQQITYTKGREGVMPNQSTTDWHSNYFLASLVYTSEKLEKIVFADGVTRIGNNAFRELPTQPEIVFPNNEFAVGDAAFYNNKEIKFEDLSKITTVGSSAFAYCENLTKLNFSKSAKSFGDNAFYGCKVGGEITIPIEVKYSNSTFSEYPDVNKITYIKGQNGASSESTGHNAANSLEAKLTNLETVIFDDKIISLHSGMFGAEVNKSIKNVKFPASIISIDAGTFVNGIDAVFYGTKNTEAEEYAKTDETIEFRPLNDFIVKEKIEKTQLGKEEQFSVVVYTDIDTEAELDWTVENSNSKKTVIDNTGKLSVGDNEKSRNITVVVANGEEKIELPVEIERNVWIVEFDAKKGEASEEALATNADYKLDSIPKAKYDYYTFDGWFTAEEDGEKISTDTVFDKDTVVYAHYSKTPVDSIEIKAGSQPKSGVAFDTSVKSVSDNVAADSVKVVYISGDKAVEGNAKCEVAYSAKITFKLKNGYTTSDKTVAKIGDSTVELKKIDGGAYEAIVSYKATTHGETVLKNAKEATEREEGYTGDKCCSICGKVLEKGTVIPKLASKTENKTTEKKAEGKSAGAGVGTISADGTILTDTTGKKYYVAAKVTEKQLKQNLMVADKKSGGKYKITKITKNKKTKKVTGGTVTYMAPYDRNCKKATMPEFVKLGGVKFKVTALNKDAFKKCKKITNVTIGKNITKIGANAFSGCAKLQSISIRSTGIKSIGSNAFKGINAKARFKVPKKQYTKYSKMIKKAKAPKTAKITK